MAFLLELMSNNAKKAIDQFLREIKEEVREKTVRVAAKAFDRITHLSPVKTGSFLLSNRIGVNAPDNGIALRLIPAYPGQKSLFQAQVRATEKPKLTTVKAFDDVHLTNRTPYGLLLESGWSNQAPIGVYRLVFAELRMGK